MKSTATKLIIQMVRDMDNVKNQALFMDPGFGSGYEFKYKDQSLIITKTKGKTLAETFYEIHIKEGEEYTSLLIDDKYKHYAELFINKLEQPLLQQLAKEKKFSFQQD